MIEQLDQDLMSVQEVRNVVRLARQAQARFREFGQERIDAVVTAMSAAAEKAAESLAKMAKEETGFGRWEDKVTKNLFAAKSVYEAIRDMKTVGIIREDSSAGITEIGVPVGVIAGLIPSTNPTSTVIYKALIALKAGNAIVFSPHPAALSCIRQAADILYQAALQSGAPEGIIGCLTAPGGESTKVLMAHADVNLILATGGEAMVRAAYSSGTPAIGVGPGNCPAFIEQSADIPMAVRRIIDSKTFDNGVICASEQSIVAEEAVEARVVSELERQGGYFLSEEESALLGGFLLRPNLTINPEIVGKSAMEISGMIGLDAPAGTRVLLSRQNSVSHQNPYSREKLAPILAFYTEQDWESACLRCLELLDNEGKGHTLSIHSRNEDVIREFGLKKTVSRVLVNTPSALGGIGATTNMFPALTLGCGAAGGSSTSENVSPMNLINIRILARGICDRDDLSGAPGSGAADSIELLVREIVNRVNAGMERQAAPTPPSGDGAQIEQLVQALLKQL